MAETVSRGTDAKWADVYERLRRESKFVGVVMLENGEEVTKRVQQPVLIEPDDLLEIELAQGLYIRMSRNKDKVFTWGGNQDPIFKALGKGMNRAERRREEREMVKRMRLITLE